MKTIKLNKYKITTSDAWIIGALSLLGLCAGFFMPQKSVMASAACLMVGVGLGLIISSMLAKTT
ncbi:hypothetical protein [Maribellus mangrovi]|uniref:hypothetical protein n=1 Tax=Maribellus mangrovi TaxID=3133146 RepID=UPI0030ED88DC